MSLKQLKTNVELRFYEFLEIPLNLKRPRYYALALLHQAINEYNAHRLKGLVYLRKLVNPTSGNM